MPERIADTQTMKISDVKSRLSSLVNEVYRTKRRVLVEKAGIPVAAIVTVEDLEWLSRLDAQRDDRWRLLDAMREPFRNVSPEEIEREAAKAVAEVRDEMNATRKATAKSA